MTRTCEYCGQTIGEDQEYFEIVATIQPQPYETDEYVMHTGCWYKLSRNFPEDN